MTPGPNRSAQLGIERLNSIGGVQNPPDITGKRIERDDDLHRARAAAIAAILAREGSITRKAKRCSKPLASARACAPPPNGAAASTG
jgi:hypothetical protein